MCQAVIIKYVADTTVLLNDPDESLSIFVADTVYVYNIGTLPIFIGHSVHWRYNLSPLSVLTSEKDLEQLISFHLFFFFDCLLFVCRHI